MANLRTDSEKVGDFMRKLTRDRKKCEKMAKDMAFATEEFAKVLGKALPKGHKIMVHLDEKDVTHVIIPLKEEIEEAEAAIKAGERPYPKEYRTNPLTKISETDEPLRAFSFRFGEYTMRRCKK